MKQFGFWLVVRFDEAVILSANSSTAGDHQTLDYVPGSALLGIAASRLYRTIEDDALRYGIFHGGAASFGNAYPLGPSGETSLPSPLSIHSPKVWPKGQEATRPFMNLVFQDRTTDLGQLTQVRGQFITKDGRRLHTRSSQSLRTAIDSRTGTAATSQLFPYAHLPAGSMFAAWIGADTEQILELLRTHLDGAARLGRSRSAEFGRCTLSVLEEKRIPFSTAATENMAVVYCVSDLALQDELGFPTRQPLAGDFGLPDGTIDWTRSHIRTRRFSPFNAALRTYETERIVIEKGSVIVFDCHGHRIEGTECQIGLYQSAGMGRVIVNPRFLLTPDFRAVEGQTLSPALQPGIKAQVLDRIPASAHFVAMIRQRTSGSVGAVEWADRFRDSLTKLYRTARAISGAAPGTPVGPSKAQWGRLDGLARDAGTKKDFLRNVSGNNILGRTAKDGSGREIFRPDEAWGSLGELDGGFVSFADWFRKCMAGELANLSAPEGMDQVRAFVRMAQSVSGAEHRGVPRRQEQNA